MTIGAKADLKLTTVANLQTNCRNFPFQGLSIAFVTKLFCNNPDDAINLHSVLV